MDLRPQASENVDIMPISSVGDNLLSPPLNPRRLAGEEYKDDITIRINSIGENNPKN